MKKIMCIFLVTVLSIVSCDRESSDVGYSYHNLYYSIVNNNDLLQQRQIASSLSSQEIYSLWMYKITEYRKNVPTTDKQDLFLKKLESLLTPKVFDENSEERKSFDFEGIMKEAKAVFGENEGYYFLNNVENIDVSLKKNLEMVKNNQSLSKLADPVISACDCVKNSDCSRLTGISWGGISWEYGTCKDTICYRRSFGWWESDNNRICKY